MSLYNNKGWLIVNVPEVDGSNYFQYVTVLQTQAPSLFTGWEKLTVFASFNNGLYFGGDGVVYKADSGFSDNGSNIECVAQQGLFNR